MKEITIEIANKIYNVVVAETEEEKTEGLQNMQELPEDEGMLFVYDEPQTVGFWMKDTTIPLDIVFIDDDYDVISVRQGEPLSEEILQEDNVKYVLEVNQNSGIRVDDELDIEDDDDDVEIKEMYIIGSNGKNQAVLVGGERIFSRPNTKMLIKLAKQAYKSKSDSDYKKLGRKAFNYIKIQDTNEPEFVDAPNI